jgi:hypothetical protein
MELKLEFCCQQNSRPNLFLCRTGYVRLIYRIAAGIANDDALRALETAAYCPVYFREAVMTAAGD